MLRNGRACGAVLMASALLAFTVAVGRADLVDFEMLDLEIQNYQSSTCMAVGPFVSEPTCIRLTVRNNGPSQGQGGCAATVRLQDPAGEVVIVETFGVFVNPTIVTLADHSYLPSQSGFFSVTCTLRPSSVADQDANLANNSRTETYEVAEVAAGPEFTCAYDSIAGELDYGVTGAPVGKVYTVTGIALQSVSLDASPGNLVGPADAGSVGVTCDGVGQGSVALTVLDGQTVVHQCLFCFDCSGVGADPSAAACQPSDAQLVPTIGPWLALGLGAILVGVAAHRRRRSMS